MDRELFGQALDGLPSGDSTAIDSETLGMLFPPGEADGAIDSRTAEAAQNFASEHGCRFSFDNQSRTSRFAKLPGRWQAIINNLCADLSNEPPDGQGLRLNVDHKPQPPPWSIAIIRQALACRERLKADVIAGPAWAWMVAPFVPQLVQRARSRSLSLEAFGPQRMTATAQASGA